jgi:mono/diheme cytochrome c family protein
MSDAGLYGRLLLILLLLFVAGSAPAQDSLRSVEEGRSLFQTNCGSCHSVHKEMTGPMLASVTKKRSSEWLHAFIKNSQKVIVSGDAYALHLFLSYNQQVMPSFREMPDTLIAEILNYIEKESINPTEQIPDERVNQVASTNILRGKELFSYQCANCHSISKEDYGPALGSVTKRLPMRWLIPFIRNSQKVIQEGDAYARYVFNAYDNKIMVPMEFLKEDEISSILDYIDFTSASSHPVAGVNGRTVQAGSSPAVTGLPADHEEDEESSFKIIFIVMALLAAGIHGFLIVKLFGYLQGRRSYRP